MMLHEVFAIITFQNAFAYEISNYLNEKSILKIEHSYIVYIVECKDWSYYIGITNDLEKRLREHNTGQDKNSYTYSRRPAELKYFETFTEVNQAIVREKQLKGWSRKKKQALIAENFNSLKVLAKSKNQK